MERVVKTLKNGTRVVFDQGKFDSWCVYLVRTNGSRYAPKDVEYFIGLQKLAAFYPKGKIFADFLEICHRTNQELNPEVLLFIEQLAATYTTEHQNLMEQWFTVLYAGMVAEENKEHAILKKRIKLLGMHQILVEHISPDNAAAFSKGRAWQELQQILIEKKL